MPAVPQSDVKINVGPQIDVGNAVAMLLARCRRSLRGGCRCAARRGRTTPAGERARRHDLDVHRSLGAVAVRTPARRRITIAPDRSACPRTASRTGWPHRPARSVCRQHAMGAAAAIGDPGRGGVAACLVVPAAGRSRLHREPRRGCARKRVRHAHPGPEDGTSPSALGPIVAPVSTGPTIPVSYDISKIAAPVNPTLVVSQPGRVDPATGVFFRPAYTVGR